MTTNSFAAAAASAADCVQHFNSMKDVRAEIISAEPGGQDGAILPGIKLDVSKPKQEFTGMWGPPPLSLDGPPPAEQGIPPEITQAIAQAKGVARIEEVIVHRDSDDNLEAVEAILKALPAEHLQRISIEMYKLTDNQVGLLERFKALTQVDLAHCSKITSAGLTKGLKPASEAIEKLNLRSTQLNDDGLELFSGMRNLKELNISYTKIKSGLGLKHLQLLPKLERLEWHANCSTGETNVVTLEAFQAGFPALKTIHFGANTINDEHIACLACCESLEKLIISTIGSTDITDEGLKPLGEKLTKLKVLSLNGSFELTDNGIAHLRSLQELEYLDVGRTKVTDKSLTTTLMNLPKLRVLDVHGTEVSYGGSEDSLRQLQSHNPSLAIVLDYMADCSGTRGAMVYGRDEPGFDTSAYLR